MNIFSSFIHFWKQTPKEIRHQLLVVLFFIAICNAFVWGFTLVLSTTYPLLVGLVALCYGLGLRHGVDADHIAAIDNATRKLMNDGKKPVSVGLFFSLGHSSIVILLSLGLLASVGYIKQHLPGFEETGSLIGTSVSSIFLIIIGAINLINLIEIIKTWKKVIHRKQTAKSKLNHHIHVKGIMTKILNPFLKTIDKSWHMYIIGFLFGLGFDTASEVALLSISAASGGSSIPIFFILLLPLSFTAAMTLVDTLDGILMLGAYGWAYVKPVRKLYYNMNITFISVLVALSIGGIEAFQLVTEKLHLTGSFYSSVNSLDFENIGYIIIGAFVVSCLFSILIYRLKNFDQLSISA